MHLREKPNVKHLRKHFSSHLLMPSAYNYIQLEVSSVALMRLLHQRVRWTGLQAYTAAFLQEKLDNTLRHKRRVKEWQRLAC